MCVYLDTDLLGVTLLPRLTSCRMSSIIAVVLPAAYISLAQQNTVTLASAPLSACEMLRAVE